MKDEQNTQALIQLWLEKSAETLGAVPVLIQEEFYGSAVNRLYYACFYAATALLLKDGKQFSKHSAVLAEINRLYVKEGRLEKHWSRFLKDLFQSRQESDYLPTATFEPAELRKQQQQAEEFVGVIHKLIDAEEN